MICHPQKGSQSILKNRMIIQPQIFCYADSFLANVKIFYSFIVYFVLYLCSSELHNKATSVSALYYLTEF